MKEQITVREACRRRMPLDGTDAKALEHALTITEKERDDLKKLLNEAVTYVELAANADNSGGEYDGECQVCAEHNGYHASRPVPCRLSAWLSKVKP